MTLRNALRGLPSPSARWLPACLAWWTLWIACHLLSGLAIVRRLAGGFTTPLPGLVYLAIAMSSGAVLLLLGWFPRPAMPAPNVLGGRWWSLSLSLAAAGLLAAATLPGTSLPASILAWSFLAGGATWLQVNWKSASGLEEPLLRANRAVATGRNSTSAPPPAENPNAAGRGAESGPLVRQIDWESESLPTGVQQQWVRSHHESGESLVGMFRVEFLPDDPWQVIHIPFCPALATVPQVTVEPLDGLPVEVKVTQIEPYGIRVEVRARRSSSADPEEAREVILGVEALAERVASDRT